MDAAPSPSSGSRFGCWTVIGAQGRFAWCKCDCGRTRKMAASALISGESTSCGCAPLSPQGLASRERERAAPRLHDWRPQR